MAIDPRLSLEVLNVGDLQKQSNDRLKTMSDIANTEFQQKRQTASDAQDAESFELDKRAQQLKEADAKIDMIGKVIGSVGDQSSYDRARQQLQSQGIDVSAYPNQYDPAVVKQAAMTTIGAKDQIKLELERAESALNQRLTQAKIGTEGAQAGAYGALANQRNAAAGLNNANASNIGRGTSQSGSSTPYRPAKPMPAAALKQENDLTEDLSIANNTQEDLDVLVKQIDSGGLKLGPVANKVSEVENYAGISSPTSRNYQSFKASMEKLRNDSLRLNKGVQTDGDAQRAWNELLANINDPQVVKQRLQEIKKINQRGAQLKEKQINNIRQNYGHEPVDAAKYKGTAAIGAGQADYSKMSDDEIRKSLGF